MNALAKISKEENEKMIDIIEGINALKVLTKTLADNEVYEKNSEMYEKIKNDLKVSMSEYRNTWRNIIEKYGLDPEKGDNYVLNFDDCSVCYIENQ